MKTFLQLVYLSILSFASVAYAEIQTQEIDYTQNGTTLKGYLAYDDAIKGKRPGILVVHEWWGHNEHARDRARMLAQIGYTALWQRKNCGPPQKGRRVHERRFQGLENLQSSLQQSQGSFAGS